MYASSASSVSDKTLKILFATNSLFRALLQKWKNEPMNFALLYEFDKYHVHLSPSEVAKLNKFLESGTGDKEWSSSTTVASAATAPSAVAVPSGAAVPPGAKTLKELARSNQDFVKLVNLYNDSASNPAVRLPLLYDFEKYHDDLSPSEVAKLDTFLVTGEGQEEWLPEISRFDPTKFSSNAARGLQALARLMPMTQCPACRKTCEAGSKCSVSGMYHMT
jgi:hypothetical protein